MNNEDLKNLLEDADASQTLDMMGIIAKVQKMLVRSVENGASEEEADTAMQMAHGMLAKHGLDMNDVQAAKDRSKAALKPLDHVVGEGLALSVSPGAG